MDRGLTRSSENRVLWLVPSRRDTSIRSLPESVQYKFLLIQSTATPSGDPSPTRNDSCLDHPLSQFMAQFRNILRISEHNYFVYVLSESGLFYSHSVFFKLASMGFSQTDSSTCYSSNSLLNRAYIYACN